jgi:hypothetical protein
MMTEAEQEYIEPSLPELPSALPPRDRLELETVVLDEDPFDAREFLERLGIETGEGDDPLTLCKNWPRRMIGAERAKLRMRYDDKTALMDLSH